MKYESNKWIRYMRNRNSMKLTFNLKAFLLFLMFLIIEIIIAVFINDSFIRPFGGDFLVIFLVYYFVKSFIQTRVLYMILGVLLFAYTVEIAQYFQIADIFQIENKILRIVIGTYFSWEDILAYTLGAVCCYLLESKVSDSKKENIKNKKEIF